MQPLWRWCSSSFPIRPKAWRKWLGWSGRAARSRPTCGTCWVAAFQLDPILVEMRAMGLAPPAPATDGSVPNGSAARFVDRRRTRGGGDREITVQRTFTDFDDFWMTKLMFPSVAPRRRGDGGRDVETLKSRVRARPTRRRRRKDHLRRTRACDKGSSAEVALPCSDESSMKELIELDPRGRPRQRRFGRRSSQGLSERFVAQGNPLCWTSPDHADHRSDGGGLAVCMVARQGPDQRGALSRG